MSQQPSQNQADEKLQREAVIIKDLQMKLQVLKNALIEERKKTTLLESSNTQMKSQLSQLEVVINEKEKEIIKLTIESLDIQNALSLERNKSMSKSSGLSVNNIIGNIFQKDTVDPIREIEIKKLEKINGELKAENELIKKEFNDFKSNSFKTNEEKSKIIQELQEKLSKNENIISEKNKTLAEYSIRLENMAESLKEFDKEKTKFTSEFQTMKKLKDDLEKQKQCLEKEMKLKDLTLKEWQEKVKKFEEENLLLANKATTYKYALAESNAVIQKFKCEKVGNPNVKCELTFGPTEDNEYVILYQEEKSKEERIKIEDVEYIKSLNQRTRNKFNEVYDIADISILVCINFFKYLQF